MLIFVLFLEIVLSKIVNGSVDKKGNEVGVIIEKADFERAIQLTGKWSGSPCTIIIIISSLIKQ